MKNKTKICALILARGGSKRLPNKNVKIFSGKPLITWTVESALKAKRFDRVFCYSDDDQIQLVRDIQVALDLFYLFR